MRGLLNYEKAFFEAKNSFGFPEVFPYTSHVDCKSWVDFDNSRKQTGQAEGLHFFCDDYKFNCLWSDPKRYVPILQRYKYVVMPDFSLYYDFPIALQIYNKFRNHWLSAFYDVRGVQMIPNISVSVSDAWDWSFLGLPTGSVVAFSDVGAIRDKASRQVTMQGYDEMLKRLQPIQVLYFTRSKVSAPSECDVVELPFIKGVT